MLLVDNHAVGLFQHGLELGQLVFDFPRTVFALDEIVDHAAADWTGTVERIERGQMFQTGRFEAAENVLHPGTFKLKHTAGQSRGKEIVGLLIVEREGVHVQIEALVLFEHLQGVVDDRQRGQGQEVHLQEPDSFHVGHRIHGRDFVFVRLVQRDEIRDRLRRNHDARGVRRGVAREAFQALGHVDQFPHAGIGLDEASEVGVLLDRLIERDVQFRGHHFGDLVDFRIRHLHPAPRIANNAARRHGSERDDLRNVFAPVLARDVIDHFAAPVHAEIDVDIGQGHALRVEKTLEEKSVLQRIDIRNAHAVGNKTACG